MTAHGERDADWQTLTERGRSTGASHWVQIRRGDAPEEAPFRRILESPATFSWRATFEPFRKELPASANAWLHFGFVEDERPAQEIVRRWQSEERLQQTMQRLSGAPGAILRERSFVDEAILKDGYLDLAVAATSSVGVSIDRRHQLAIASRLVAAGAERIGGQYALELLLPTGFGWNDVPMLRKMRALRDYRAVLRDVEAAALSGATTAEDLGRRVHAYYADRLAVASARGLPGRGKVALAFIGFVLGTAVDAQAPLIGGATVTAAGLASEKLIERVLRQRWLSVHRRIRSGPDGL